MSLICFYIGKSFIPACIDVRAFFETTDSITKDMSSIAASLQTHGSLLYLKKRNK